MLMSARVSQLNLRRQHTHTIRARLCVCEPDLSGWKTVTQILVWPDVLARAGRLAASLLADSLALSLLRRRGPASELGRVCSRGQKHLYTKDSRLPAVSGDFERYVRQCRAL